MDDDPPVRAHLIHRPDEASPPRQLPSMTFGTDTRLHRRLAHVLLPAEVDVHPRARFLAVVCCE